jgi:small conductance mechanosensitive channel
MQLHFEKWFESILPWVLDHGVKVLLILAGAYLLNLFIHKLIEKSVRMLVRPDNFLSKEAEIKRENTLIHIFSITIKTVLIILAVMMSLQEMGVMIGPMIAAAGILGLAFGFGGQYLIRDIITGLFIIMENQYRIGDLVTLENVSGIVEEISLRKTTLRDVDGTVHHVPHGEIKTVSNLTKDYSIVIVEVGVSYKSDLDSVIAVINKTGNELAEDPAWKNLIRKPIQFLRVDNFAESAIIMRMSGEAKVGERLTLAGEFRKRLKNAFDKENIEIPFNQVVVHQAK